MDLNTANADHLAKHGYPLLVIGREYLFEGKQWKLTHADDDSLCRLQRRHAGEVEIVYGEHLTWLPDAD
jgi:hypothetical protein